MLDFSIPDFIADWRKVSNLKKWVRLLMGCWAAAFIGFSGGFSLSAGAMLAYSHQIPLSMATGAIGGAGMMAACVMLTIHRQGMWLELGIALPKQFETILEGTDISQPVASKDTMTSAEKSAAAVMR